VYEEEAYIRKVLEKYPWADQARLSRSQGGFPDEKARLDYEYHKVRGHRSAAAGERARGGPVAL
jgi:hypothetical protein